MPSVTLVLENREQDAPYGFFLISYSDDRQGSGNPSGMLHGPSGMRVKEDVLKLLEWLLETFQDLLNCGKSKILFLRDEH